MHKRDASEPTALEEARRAGHEPTDVSAGSMVRWGIGLLVLMFGSMLAMLVLYIAFGAPFRAKPVVTQENRLEPWPRLQSNPLKDIAEFEREQTELETGYAWVDPTQGRVRIPLDRAMDIVATRGLPKWPAPRTPKGDVQ